MIRVGFYVGIVLPIVARATFDPLHPMQWVEGAAVKTDSKSKNSFTDDPGRS